MNASRRLLPVDHWTAILVVGIIAFGGLGPIGLILPLATLLAMVLPWPFARYVAIPLGLPAVAGFLASLSDIFAVDRAGGSALAAAWALARKSSLDGTHGETVASKLSALQPVRGAGVVGSAFLLAARGDDAGARSLLEVLPTIDDQACPLVARHVAASFLAAEAAERGDWNRVAEIGRSPSCGRLPLLLSGIGECLQHSPSAPSPWNLWLRWVLAPERRATLPMVRRALLARSSATSIPTAEAPSSAGEDGRDPFLRALVLHASLLGESTTLREEEVRAIGEAWDAAFSGEGLLRDVKNRAAALGTEAGPSALEHVREAIEHDLEQLALASELSLEALPAASQVLGRVRTRLRDKILADIESASEQLRRRSREKRALPTVDEWREWADLVALYRRGVARFGDEVRRLAFTKVYPDASGFACWLFNERSERPLGNAVFRFLLEEAEALADEQAVRLCQKNVDCGV